MTWFEYGLSLARVVAQKSKDPNTKVGCVILGANNEVLGTGFNGFPRGLDESIEERWERPTKYDYVVHAETNAIVLSRRDLRGATLYCTHLPCKECVKLIIQAGIECVIVDKSQRLTDLQSRDGDFSKRALIEAGVKIYWE